MIVKKYRWSRHYEAAEEELQNLLHAKNIDAKRWTGDAFEDYPIHSHPTHKQVWCAEGSITFTINDREITLQAGDALDVPAQTQHRAVAGFSGVVCYEFMSKS